MRTLFRLVGNGGGAHSLAGVCHAALAWSAAWLAAGTAGGANLSWNNDYGNWSTPGNWSPAGPPAPADAVFIGNLLIAENAFVTLNVNATISSLAITDGMALNTNGHTLLVNGDVTVSGENSDPNNNIVYPSRIQVEKSGNSDDLDVNNLTVSNGAGIEVEDGGVIEVDNVFTIGADSNLYGNGVIDFEGNEARVFVNDGIVQAAPGAMVFNQNGAGRIDLDGNSGNGRLSIATYSNITQEYSTLTINGDQLSDAFSGEITLGGGFLAMNLSAGGWTADAASEITFIGDAADPATLSGSHASMFGLSNVFNVAEIVAESTWGATGDVLLRNNAELRLVGKATLASATIEQAPMASGGVVTNNGGVTVVSDTTVSLPTGVFDMDGDAANSTLTLNGGVAFMLNVEAIDDDQASDPFEGAIYLNAGSTLAVNTAAAWTNDGSVSSVGGLLTGSGLVNSGLIVGYGSVEPATLDNDGTIGAVGGLLTVHAVGATDLDGANKSGVLSASVGNLTVEGINELQEFDGEVHVALNGSAQTFLMPTGGLDNRGLIDLNGGEYRAGLLQNGQLTVDFKSRIVTNGRFGALGVSSLAADLELEGTFDVEAGAAFSGAGDLVVLGDSALQGEKGATVAVHVDNFGLVAPGETEPDDLGVLNVAQYTNEKQGRLAIDILAAGGLAGVGHDLLDVRGTAALLGGTLEASFLAGFTPSLGDEFLVVRTLQGVTGTFDQLVQPPLPDVKLSLVYDDFTVKLVAVAIPEPSGAVLAICGLFAGWRGFGRPWRKRHQK